MQGECLCGAVKFEIAGELPNLYQCHCSLCRKATGSNANAATLVHQENFKWISGQENITSFQKATDYRSDFCSVCGSPTPNPLRNSNLMWIPAGLLTGDIDAEIVVHFHMASSASWDKDSEHCIRLEADPESINSLNEMLQRTRC